jgi:HEAT repeat protein
MDKNLRKSLNDLESTDDAVRMKAVKTVLAATDSRVNWIYEEWDSLVRKLDDENSFQRSIAIMVLCNLAAMPAAHLEGRRGDPIHAGEGDPAPRDAVRGMRNGKTLQSAPAGYRHFSK